MSERRDGADSKPIASRGLLTRVSTWFVINIIMLGALLAVHFATSVASLKWWTDVFALATNLLAGGLVSFLFYYLVVHLPEARKKSTIQGNLQRVYQGIKKDILWAVVHASIKGGRRDLTPSMEFVESLMTPIGFKAAFDGGREAHEGFHAFVNQMHDDTHEFRQIVLALQMLSKQIEFVLHNYPVDDQHVSEFFKRLELLLMRLQASGPGYDESKPLCRFVWEVYAGWNWLDGDVGHDRIQKMISDL